MSDTTKRKFHVGQRSITIWANTDLADRIEQHLASKVAGQTGVKASRQAWLLELIERELAAAQAVHP